MGFERKGEKVKTKERILKRLTSLKRKLKRESDYANSVPDNEPRWVPFAEKEVKVLEWVLRK